MFLVGTLIAAVVQNQNHTGGKKKSIKRNSKSHKKKDRIPRKTKTKLKFKENNIRYYKSGGAWYNNNDAQQLGEELVMNFYSGLGRMLTTGCWFRQY